MGSKWLWGLALFILVGSFIYGEYRVSQKEKVFASKLRDAEEQSRTLQARIDTLLQQQRDQGGQSSQELDRLRTQLTAKESEFSVAVAGQKDAVDRLKAQLAAKEAEVKVLTEQKTSLERVVTAMKEQLAAVQQSLDELKENKGKTQALVEAIKKAEDASFNAEYALASQSSRAIADRIQAALRQGSSMRDILANPYMRETVKNDPLLIKLVERAARQELEPKPTEPAPSESDGIRMLASKDVRAREAAIEILAKVKSPKAVDALLGALADEHPWIQSCAATALGKLKETRAVKPFLAILQDSKRHVSVKARVCEALGQIGEASAVGPMAELLRPKVQRLKTPEGGYVEIPIDPVQGNSKEISNLRLQARAALKSIGTKEALEAVAEVERDEEAGRAMALAQAYFGAGAYGKAKPLLEDIRARYPGTEVASRVGEMLKSISDATTRPATSRPTP